MSVTAVPGLRAQFACELEFQPNAYPSYSAPSSSIGYDGTGYAKAGLVCPEPIPLGVSVSDADTMLIFCGGSCVSVGVPGAWTAAWVRGAPDGDPGNFLDAHAAQVTVVSDAPNVIFLPSKDLDLGETRVTSVTASIVNACSQGFADPNARITR